MLIKTQALQEVAWEPQWFFSSFAMSGLSIHEVLKKVYCALEPQDEWSVDLTPILSVPHRACPKYFPSALGSPCTKLLG